MTRLLLLSLLLVVTLAGCGSEADDVAEMLRDTVGVCSMPVGSEHDLIGIDADGHTFRATVKRISADKYAYYEGSNPTVFVERAKICGSK